ncbi:MAG TPA: magnesium transporter CorA family protein [Thermoanaerobaculia bacterium]|nr:magnesium transporter CorA family protein [Thermoanaerobaculia bacterium]
MTAAVPPASAGTGLFHGVSFDRRDRSVRRFAREEFAAELEREEVFSWIDIEAQTIEPLNEILSAIGMDLVLTSHFDEPEVLPRIVERHDCLAFYLYEIVNPEKHLDTRREITPIDFARMILIIGIDYVITYHRGGVAAVDYVKEVAEENFRLAGKTPGFIAFLFLQRCLYDYAHLNLANDNFLDSLEQGVLTESHEDIAPKIAVASSNILTLKKLVASVHIVLMQMVMKHSPFISGEARFSFSEMQQNAVAIRAAVDSSRDLLDGIVRRLQAVAANRTSDIAKVLTVVSTIVLPLTLIAGVYGMNFAYMPELRWRFGYFGVLSGMVGIAVALLLLFRRLGWIGGGQRG